MTRYRTIAAALEGCGLPNVRVTGRGANLDLTALEVLLGIAE